MSNVTQAAINTWVPGDQEANVAVWQAISGGEVGVSGNQVVEMMVDILTYISSEIGQIDSTPGSHVEGEWRSEMGDSIGQGVLTMLDCWQCCDDRYRHLYDSVRIMATADMARDGDLTERVFCCLLDLAASLRDGVAKLALLDDEGVRVIR